MTYDIVKKHLKFNFNPGINILDALWGMVVHCTDDPGATGQNEFDYYNGGDRQASAHTFIDDTSITEALTVEPNQVDRAWHAGATANNHYIGVEMCMPKSHNPVFFKKVWDRAVWYFSNKFITILKMTKVEGPVYSNRVPITKGNLMSHHEVSLLWKETTHIDPDAYFAEYGKTVNDFRNAVQLEINAQTLPVVDLKKNAAEYLKNKGYTKSLHDPLELVDIGTLGAIIQNMDSLKQ